MPLSHNDPGFILPSTSLDLEYQYDLQLEAPPGGQSTQGIAPDSSLAAHDIPDFSSFLPQIASPVDDMARFCAICSTSTPPLPPIHAPQATAFPPPGWFEIPQTVYKQKQWDYTPSEPILFHVNGRPGVNMGDAFRKTFMDLDGRDNLMLLQDTRTAVSCRLSVRLSYQHLSDKGPDRLVSSSPDTHATVHPRWEYFSGLSCHALTLMEDLHEEMGQGTWPNDAR